MKLITELTEDIKYLTEEKGYEVHSVIVNTGGFTDDELKKVEAHAYKLGVKTHTAVNAVKSYYDNGVRYFDIDGLQHAYKLRHVK